MTFQQMIIESTRPAAAEAFRYAKKVPADKLDWKPLDQGRSVLDLCREIAMCPKWATTLMAREGFPENEEEESETLKDASVEDLEQLCLQNLEEFYTAVAAFPDDRMNETFTMPGTENLTFTMRENLEFPRWNFMYHEGQIAYIQTLYGDKEMYF